MAESSSPMIYLDRFFQYSHLPEHLRVVSEPFARLATHMIESLPHNPELGMALRKLLEAKDCAVRAALTIDLPSGPKLQEKSQMTAFSKTIEAFVGQEVTITPMLGVSLPDIGNSPFRLIGYDEHGVVLEPTTGTTVFFPWAAGFYIRATSKIDWGRKVA